MKVLRTQMPLTCCFWTLRLTVVRSLPKSSDVMTCDSSASIQPSTSSQLCLKRTERFASNNFSPLALVISSSSSHCSFRFFRIGSSWSLHSGFSRISASPSWNSATQVFNNSAKIQTHVLNNSAKIQTHVFNNSAKIQTCVFNNSAKIHTQVIAQHDYYPAIILCYNTMTRKSHILLVTTFRLSHDVNMERLPKEWWSLTLKLTRLKKIQVRKYIAFF